MWRPPVFMPRASGPCTAPWGRRLWPQSPGLSLTTLGPFLQLIFERSKQGQRHGAPPWPNHRAQECTRNFSVAGLAGGCKDGVSLQSRTPSVVSSRFPERRRLKVWQDLFRGAPRHGLFFFFYWQRGLAAVPCYLDPRRGGVIGPSLQPVRGRLNYVGEVIGDRR